MENLLTRLPRTQLQRYGETREALRLVTADAPEGTSTDWGTLNTRIDNAARALCVLGIEPQQMVAVFAPNCPEIPVTDFGCFYNRAIPVSLYATSSPEQVQFIVRDSGARLLFAGTQAQYETALSIRDNCPGLMCIIVYDQDFVRAEGDTTSMRFDEFMELGAQADKHIIDTVEARLADAVPEDIATLLYTSGTTGEPKGAILPHSNFNAVFRFHEQRLTQLSDRDTSLCFLPLSHIFEKAWTYFCLYMGIKVFINFDPKEIQPVIRHVRPTSMSSVPRFWEKVYTAIQEKIDNMRGIPRMMVRQALKVGRRRNLDYVRHNRPVPSWLEMRYRFFDRYVFQPMKRAVGIQNGNIYPTAGAPLSPKITEFFHICGVNVVIGYGLSETTATVSCFPDYNYVFGTVGEVLPGVEVSIGDNDEILVKGPTVMRGYYNRPDATAEAFTSDGWFRTGDAGYFDEHGQLVLTERIKDLFKTSNGKYIAPQALENAIGLDSYIEQVAVIGDQRKFVTALIVPNMGALRQYADREGIPYADDTQLVDNPAVKNFIADRINELQKDFAGYEKIKRFTLLAHEFTMDSGELTNTLKIKRPVIYRNYARQIDEMYE